VIYAYLRDDLQRRSYTIVDALARRDRAIPTLLSMRRLPMIAIAIAAPAMWDCAGAFVSLAELGAYDGVYTLSGTGPPNRVPLTGTLTIANGNYVLDTSLGTCKKQPLKVPKPWFSTAGHDYIQDPTKFGCGDLSMHILLSDGRVSGGLGYYFSEKRVALPPVCVALASDSAGRERGDCARWRTDYDVVSTQHSYGIRITREF
jgi:hypothetical protein